MPNEDADCDGTITADDCDDNDPESYTISEDGDCDGVLTADDCDDSNATSTTLATDGDCDGTITADDCDDNDASSTVIAEDADCDGVLTADDCDDNNATTYPGAIDTWYDGTDSNCDGFSDYDQDGDGEDADAHNGVDCDDTNAAINTQATEIWYDGVDQDCDNGSDYDQDGDGVDSNLHGGTDCDDTNAAINTQADDGNTAINGIDDDCDGIADQESFLDISLLIAGDLVITEVMPNPVAVSDANGEWFKIYNDSGVGLNLNGLGFMDDGSDDFSISGDLYLPASEYLVLGKSDDINTNGGVNVDYAYGSGMGLTNSTDELYIYTSTEFIDDIAWDNGATFPNPSGASISLNPGTSAADNDSGYNWCEATSSYGDGDLGTPGEENDTCPPLSSNATDVAPVMGSCMGCHGGQFFSSYTTLMGAMSGDFRSNNASANTPLVVPGDAAGSYLYQKMTGTASAGETMSSSASQRAAVELWINQGANP